jgi:hypothetical protein
MIAKTPNRSILDAQLSVRPNGQIVGPGWHSKIIRDAQSQHPGQRPEIFAGCRPRMVISAFAERSFDRFANAE